MVELKLTVNADDKSAAVVDAIETHFSQSLQQISDDVGGLSGKFEEAADKMVETMREAGNRIGKSLKAKSGGSGVSGFLPDILLKGMKAVPGLIKGALSGIGSVVWAAFSAIPGIISTIFTTAFGAIKTIAGAALSGIGFVVEKSFAGFGFFLDKVVLAPFKLVFNKITALAGGIGLAWGAKVAAGVQDSLSVALALIPDKVTPKFRTGLLRTLEDIRAETGAAGELIGTTLYNSISAGAKDMPGPLTEAAVKIAVLGGQAEAAEPFLALIAQSANSMGKELTDALRIADLYQKTITEGILRPQDLAMNMGRLLPFVQNLKLDMADLMGVVAQSSKTFRPEQLFTGLQNMLAKAMDPAFLKTLREEINVELFNLQGEFVGVSEMIERIAETAPSDALVKKLFPDIRSLKFFQTMRQQLTATDATIAAVANNLGAIETSWEERSRSVQLQTTRLTGSIGNLFSEMFEAIEEDLAGFLGYGTEVLGNIVGKVRELKDEGKFDEWKASIAETLGELGKYVPTLDQVGGAMHTVLVTGVTAWRGMKNEFSVLKQGVVDFFTGNDVDLSQSNLVLGGQIAFEHLKKYATEGVTFAKNALANLVDSDVAQTIAAKFDAIGRLIKHKLKGVVSDVAGGFGILWREGLYNSTEAFLKAADTIFPGKGINNLSFITDTLRKNLIDYRREYLKDDNGLERDKILSDLGAPVVLPEIKFESNTLDALEQEFSDRLSNMQKGAEETARKIEAPIVQAAEKVRNVVKDIGTVEAKPEPVDHTQEINLLNARARWLQNIVDTKKKESEELYQEQGKAVRTTGETDPAIAADIKSQKEEINRLQGEITELRAKVSELRAGPAEAPAPADEIAPIKADTEQIKTTTAQKTTRLDELRTEFHQVAEELSRSDQTDTDILGEIIKRFDQLRSEIAQEREKRLQLAASLAR